MGTFDNMRDAQEKAGRAHARSLPSPEEFAILSSQFNTAAQMGVALVDPPTAHRLSLIFASLSIAIIAVPTE